MPVAPTYPGVYIEEIPSGVRTIVGVPTSIAAFLGRTISGPPNQPVTIFSFADFARTFGGMSPDLPMGYAVNDFYQNGGGQAIIVRLVAAGSAPATFPLSDGLNLVAVSAGSWGNALSTSVDTDNITPEIATKLGLAVKDLFNLTVNVRQNGKDVSAERYLNVTVNPKATLPAGRARLLSTVLAQSQLLNVAAGTDWTKVTPPAPPKAATSTATPKVAGKAGAGKAASADENDAEATGAGTPAGGTLSGGPLDASATAPATATGGTDGGPLADSDYAPVVSDVSETGSGIYALKTADIFNILCIPPDSFTTDVSLPVYQAAMEYCAKRRAILLVDSPLFWSANPANAANTVVAKFTNPAVKDADNSNLPDLSLTGDSARNAAIYFPRLIESDPMVKGGTVTMAPCGAVAGVMARTDVQRGVWKAPAGLDASLNGILGLDVNLTNDENGMLNPLGINCLRSFPVGQRVVWGARTMRGADQSADDYKYLPVRRLALFIEETLYRGTQWVVFEPNDAPLWASIRLNIGAFMHDLFTQGAFQGTTPTAAYFVKCDSTTTTQNDINRGVVNILVGFAPLKPAEFVVLQIQQIAGDIQT